MGIFAQDIQGHKTVSIASTWDALIGMEGLAAYLWKAWEQGENLALPSTLWAPVESQEIWAAGVTYLRSKVARMEESQASGGATFYDKVYDAERPELFFKSAGWRAKGHGEAVRIRRDATWNVPEPELALCIQPKGHIIGYSIGNDMSSRDIEGENPLYLPQAKVYNGSTGLGPCLLVTEQALPMDTQIEMRIFRGDSLVFEGKTQRSQLKRGLEELVDYLTREMDFPHGAYLMTGTCIVPDPPFTLAAGDRIEMEIQPIGVLSQTVASI